MKHFLTVFTLVFICVILSVTAGFIVYGKFATPFDDTENDPDKEYEIPVGNQNGQTPDGEDGKNLLKEAFEKSNRVNFLVMGLEGVRTDTIIFVSYDLDNNKADLISIPRDTYFVRGGKEEYKEAAERKVNAVYGDNGTQALKNVVSHILKGVPIEHYVKVRYKGVKTIVDILGGVEVNVKEPMNYKDPYDKPPLIIDIPAGRQVLDGENAVKFLRYRGYKNADLGRINAQQEFIKSAIKKSMSLKIVPVINTAFHYVNTDMTISQLGAYGIEAVKMDLSEDLNIITLPGYTERRTYGGEELDYFLHDPKQVEQILMEIYNVEDKNE